jgi:superfamily II DNA/RNA helicase
MTPERCTSLFFLHDDFLENIGLVVFDEFHIINNDSSRSMTCMTCLVRSLAEKPGADYLLVSAMVSNGKEISEWVQESTNHTCLNLDLSWKPTTQLQGTVIYKKNDVENLQQIVNAEKQTGKTKNPGKQLKGEMTILPYCLFGLKGQWKTLDTGDYYLAPILNGNSLFDINKYWHIVSNKNKVGLDIAGNFSKHDKKVILFVNNPQIASSLSDYAKSLEKLSEYNADQVIGEYNNVFEELGGEQYSFIERRPSVVLHDGQMLPEERLFSEKLFKDSHGINILIATPTLAQGINLPVDIVIIAGDDRYDINYGGMDQLKPHEILNAAGRAGRAGFHSAGTAILIPSDIITIEGNKIKGAWGKLKDNIFSKGDQCLEVQDPIETFLQKIQSGDVVEEEEIFLNRFSVDKEAVDHLLPKSFFAYQCKLQNRQDKLQELKDKLMSLLNEEENETREWVRKIALNEGVNIKQISVLADFFRDNWTENLEQPDIATLLNLYFCYLKKVEPYKNSNTIANVIREALKLDSNVQIEKCHIDKFELLIKDYVNGKPFVELNSLLTNKNDKKLNSARKFVIRCIPKISYQIGIFAMTLVEYLKDSGVREISDEILNFATIVKEGVSSFEMLKYKKDMHYMRVETHIKSKG